MFSLQLGLMVCVVCAGGFAFKQYLATGLAVWLVAGFAAYNISNLFWLTLIDQAGLARAMAYSAACQIVIVTLVGASLGEHVGRWGWLAAVLASGAVIIASFAGPDLSRSIDQPQATAQPASKDTES